MQSTFRKGGIHPEDNKYYTAKAKIKRIDLPEFLTIPMSQHIGAPAELIKKEGDRVEKGELIGRATSFVSSNIHSPVRGEIVQIKKVVLANGNLSDAVVIKVSSKQPELFTKPRDYSKFNKQKLWDIVKENGIVGMGGATFPAHVKLSIPEGKKVEALVINGVECEPYLTSDHRLMLEKTKELLEGIMICAKIVEPEMIYIGIEDNKPDAIKKVSSLVQKLKLPIEVVSLKKKFPQGDEKQLLKAVLNREIPSGKLPIDVSGVIVNAGSAYAIYEAVVYKKPLFERIVTVSGDCIKKPGNFIVPVGTSVSELIKAAKGFKKEPDKLISGGPMMGFAFFDEETPITKGSSGILAITDKKNYETTPCLSCGKCVAACPIGLEPTKMYALISNGKYELAMKEHLMDCKECGCCTYSCPAHINLVQAFKTGKKMGKKK